MTKHGAPMPDSLRTLFRARQHPARSVECPHCGAAANRPCRNQQRTRVMTDLHPRRISAWAVTVACCPACQVEPGVECHTEGRPLTYAHPRREVEAQEVAA